MAAVLLQLVVGVSASADLTVEAHLETVAALFGEGDYGAAIDGVEAALQGHEDVRLRHWLARGHYELESYESAVAAAEDAVDLEPASSEYHRWLGKCYGRLAEQKSSFFLARKVKKQFVEAVELDGSNLEARRDLLQFLVKAPFFVGGSKSGARKQAEAIFAQDPVEGHLAWAYYLRKTDEPDEARQRYDQVLALRSDNADSYFEMADFGAETGDGAVVARAIAAAESSALADHRLDYYRGVAAVLTGAGHEEGAAALERYLADAPKSSERPPHAEAHEWLGDAHSALGDDAKAAEHYRSALALDADADGVEEKLAAVG